MKHFNRAGLKVIGAGTIACGILLWMRGVGKGPYGWGNEPILSPIAQVGGILLMAVGARAFSARSAA